MNQTTTQKKGLQIGKAAMQLGMIAIVVGVLLPWYTQIVFGTRPNPYLAQNPAAPPTDSYVISETPMFGWQINYPIPSTGLLLPIGFLMLLTGIWIYIFNRAKRTNRVASISTVLLLLTIAGLTIAMSITAANVSGSTVMSGSDGGVGCSPCLGSYLCYPEPYGKYLWFQSSD